MPAQPRFHRGDDFVAVRVIRLSERSFIAPGEPLERGRFSQKQLRRWHRRRMIGRAGHGWTRGRIARFGITESEAAYRAAQRRAKLEAEEASRAAERKRAAALQAASDAQQAEEAAEQVARATERAAEARAAAERALEEADEAAADAAAALEVVEEMRPPTAAEIEDDVDEILEDGSSSSDREAEQLEQVRTELEQLRLEFATVPLTEETREQRKAIAERITEISELLESAS